MIPFYDSKRRLPPLDAASLRRGVPAALRPVHTFLLSDPTLNAVRKELLASDAKTALPSGQTLAEYIAEYYSVFGEEYEDSMTSRQLPADLEKRLISEAVSFVQQKMQLLTDLDQKGQMRYLSYLGSQRPIGRPEMVSNKEDLASKKAEGIVYPWLKRTPE